MGINIMIFIVLIFILIAWIYEIRDNIRLREENQSLSEQLNDFYHEKGLDH